MSPKRRTISSMATLVVVVGGLGHAPLSTSAAAASSPPAAVAEGPPAVGAPVSAGATETRPAMAQHRKAGGAAAAAPTLPTPLGTAGPQPPVPPASAKGPPSRLSDLPAPPTSIRPADTIQVDRRAATAAAQPLGQTPPTAVRGWDHALWVLRGTGWQSLGGDLVADPAVVMVASTTVPAPAPPQPPAYSPLYVATGTDASLWDRRDTGDWQRLTPTSTRCTGSPGAVVTGAPGTLTLTVACRGGDAAAWIAATPLDALALPEITSFGPAGGSLAGDGLSGAPIGGQPVFFGVGGDGAVWQLAGGVWSLAGLECYGHPIASGDGTTTTAACQALDGTMHYLTGAGAGWSSSQPAGGCVEEVLAVRPVTNAALVDVAGCDNAVWETSVTTTGVGGWQFLGGLVAPTAQAPYVLGVPVIAQQMPLDCEAAALQMGLIAAGHNVSQAALVGLEHPDTRRAVWLGRTLHWGDPYTNFVGNVNGSERYYTGYGVYWPVIQAVARALGASGSTGGEGLRPLDIYDALARGRPVVAWVEYQWARPAVRSWIAWDGRTVRYTTWEHAVTLRGVSPTAVLVNDPAHGRSYWIDRATFENSWRDFNDMGVVIQ